MHDHRMHDHGTLCSTFYAEGGKLDVWRGLRECMWHSVSHTLSIDVFRVSSFSARIVTVAYAFLVLIITHTYTANLAAFLTVDRLHAKFNSVADLKGKAVATVAPYVGRLALNHGIAASTVDGAPPPPPLPAPCHVRRRHGVMPQRFPPVFKLHEGSTDPLTRPRVPQRVQLRSPSSGSKQAQRHLLVFVACSRDTTGRGRTESPASNTCVAIPDHAARGLTCM